MNAFSHRAPVSLVFILLLTVAVGPAYAQTGGGTASPLAGASATQRAGLIVRFADGTVQTACVSFNEPSLTGDQLLQRSGFKAVVDPAGALGGAICSINDQGCAYPAQDCFCRCTGSQCEYWAYYQWQNGAWQYSQAGAAAVKVKDGDLQGWSWGPGNFTSGTEPPAVAFADVCQNAAAISPASQTSAASTSPTPAPGPGGVLQYVAYAAIALVLLGAGGFVLLRRKA